jgi:methylmalonyl-CoA mutase C-terminal domain/subunit
MAASSSTLTTPVRIVLAKGGLDAHERGVHVVARGLRDVGFEVIYLGLRQPPERIARVALDEDADAVGISVLSGNHMGFIRETVHQLRAVGSSAVLVVGGLVPSEDQAALLAEGVDMFFGPGSLVQEIAAEMRVLVTKRRG